MQSAQGSQAAVMNASSGSASATPSPAASSSPASSPGAAAALKKSSARADTGASDPYANGAQNAAQAAGVAAQKAGENPEQVQEAETAAYNGYTTTNGNAGVAAQSTGLDPAQSNTTGSSAPTTNSPAVAAAGSSPVQASISGSGAAMNNGVYNTGTTLGNAAPSPNDVIYAEPWMGNYASNVANEVSDPTISPEGGIALAKGMTAAHGTNTVAQGYTASAPAAGAQQNALMASLAAESAGGGAVQQASRAQLQSGTDQAIATQMALAASQQGGNPMLAYRNAQNNAATLQQQNANSAAALTASNSLAAQSQLANVADTAAGQQIGESQFNAGAQQQNSEWNAGQAQSESQFDASQSNAVQAQQQALYSQYINAGMSQEQALYVSQQQAAEFLTGNATTNAGIAANLSVANSQMTGQIAGAGINAAGAMLGGLGGASTATGAQATVQPNAGTPQDPNQTSDKRAKKNIGDGEEETLAFLRALKPKGFEYKDEANGKGHLIGVMAQDVEKAAPDVIIDDTDGVKKIDIRKALSASLASLGTVNKRLEKLESKRG